jgi:hypothetical protein
LDLGYPSHPPSLAMTHAAQARELRFRPSRSSRPDLIRAPRRRRLRLARRVPSLDARVKPAHDAERGLPSPARERPHGAHRQRCWSLRDRLTEQIRRLVISSPTKVLTSMKAGVFDASEPLCSLEVGPTAPSHMHALGYPFNRS